MSSTLNPPPAASARLGTASAYEQITQRIIALMEAGTVPWQKPWKVLTGMPRNLISKRHYRGINLLMLLAADYESPFWLTFRQANELGGHIRKGERATPVVFWKQLKKSNDPEDNPQPDESKPDPTERKRPRIVARLYSVFNVVQCEGLSNFPSLPDQLGTLPEPAKVYENMPDRPVIKHGMRSAFYSPLDDVVGLPTLTNFSNEDAYYGTLFHELTHASGASKRLNRPTLTASAGFGSDPYCKEELIAELGAAFLSAHVGIAERTIDNSAAYIKNWIDRLKNVSVR
jgi:antirestriction protein ArdC